MRTKIVTGVDCVYVNKAKLSNLPQKNLYKFTESYLFRPPNIRR